MKNECLAYYNCVPYVRGPPFRTTYLCEIAKLGQRRFGRIRFGDATGIQVTLACNPLPSVPDHGTGSVRAIREKGEKLNMRPERQKIGSM